MWFKNLVPYRFTSDCSLTASAIEQSLAAYPFVPCGAHDSKALGWISPFGLADAPLVQCTGSQFLLCTRQEEKLLPAAVVNQVLQQRLEQWAHAPPNRAKKQALREQIVSDLLPRAFSKFQETRIWIDSCNGWLVVDTTSVQKAEAILALLRQSLGSLPVAPWMQQITLATQLTQWVAADTLPAEFTLQEEAELRSLQVGGGIIRCKQQPLDSEEIAGHLAANKVVTKLALAWQSELQFILTEEGLLKRLKFAEALQQQNDDFDGDEKLQRLEADFVLATGTLTALLQALDKQFVGDELLVIPPYPLLTSDLMETKESNHV
jgi:recombination associated protein RdgC